MFYLFVGSLCAVLLLLDLPLPSLLPLLLLWWRLEPLWDAEES